MSELKSKVLEERKLLNEILELLFEVSSRKLFLDMAYPSLFEFCVKEQKRNLKSKWEYLDKGECSFLNKETGEVCQSKHFLQYDHIREFSKRGLSNDPNNIRLLCGAHNRHRRNERKIHDL